MVMTLDNPSYEGRPLANPDEELVDQGLQFDLGTLMKRRGLMHLVGVGAGTIGLAACASETPTADGSTSVATTAEATAEATASASETSEAVESISEIPDETAGPYPGDGSNGADVLEQSGVVRQDIRSSFGTSTTTAEGIEMELELKIIDMANGNVPFAGVAVYVWHCNREGEYSMYSEAITNENYLRGVQIADDSGVVKFTSIFPACYSGRWPHIHFEVYPDEASIVDSTNAICTSQVALPKDVCDTVYGADGYEQSVSNLSQLSLGTDNVFGEDEGELQLATVTGDNNSGYHVSLNVGVDTGTEPTSGSMPNDDGRPGSATGRRP